jgi:hypothetical protein
MKRPIPDPRTRQFVFDLDLVGSASTAQAAVLPITAIGSQIAARS